MRTAILIPAKQRGAILVVSLLLLLVMTVLGLTASQSTRMQERMAGNSRNLELAFQAGEAGLRGAETRIDEELVRKGNSITRCAGMVPEEEDDPECDVIDRNATLPNFTHADATWWSENAVALDAELQGVSSQPYFVTEEWADVPDTLTMGSSLQKSGTLYHVNTSRAVGGDSNASVIIETTYAVRY